VSSRPYPSRRQIRQQERAGEWSRSADAGGRSPGAGRASWDQEQQAATRRRRVRGGSRGRVRRTRAHRSAGLVLAAAGLLGTCSVVWAALNGGNPSVTAMHTPGTTTSVESEGDPSEPDPGPARSTGTKTPASRAGASFPMAVDKAAGVLSKTFPQTGTGKIASVAGTAAAPGPGPVKKVRVEVEGGLPIKSTLFASYVMKTLNDSRGWGHGGKMTFARTTGSADIVVTLASPKTSEKLCKPLETGGTLSCGIGSRAVLTVYRWVLTTPEFSDTREKYRQYLINHEVGHVLGHGHEQCAGKGRLAPVMMQQTKGLKGCLANPWPNP